MDKISMNNTYEQMKKQHPCFGGHRSGRIHLPVCPGCNIGCRFCERAVNGFENRPGVTAQVLTPEEALEVLGQALALCPDIHVAGIAGPGDTLATDFALETFRMINESFPRLFKCMSTNGLLLYEKAEEILDVGIDTLTVTVNAVDPAVESKLNRYILYHGIRYEGEEAAAILIENQMKGIRKLARAGTVIKINTVLVPGINDAHIEMVAKTVSALGASIYNIIPLIPQYELKDVPAPRCVQIDGARTRAEKYIDVFRHCQHCRADAAGVPGVSEFGPQLYKDKIQVRETFSHG